MYSTLLHVIATLLAIGTGCSQVIGQTVTVDFQGKAQICPSAQNQELLVVCGLRLKELITNETDAVAMIKLNGTQILDSTKLRKVGKEQLELNHTVKLIKPGRLFAECIAINHGKWRLLGKASIGILGPPLKAPKISYKYITSSDKPVQPETIMDTIPISVPVLGVTLLCDVSGGFPDVSNVTIACGSDTLSATNDGTTASLQIMASSWRSDRTVCTCSASHKTGCYDQTASVTIVDGLASALETQMRQGYSDYIFIAVTSGGGISVLCNIILVAVLVFVMKKSGTLMREKENSNGAVSVTVPSHLVGRPTGSSDSDITAPAANNSSPRLPPAKPPPVMPRNRRSRPTKHGNPQPFKEDDVCDYVQPIDVRRLQEVVDIDPCLYYSQTETLKATGSELNFTSNDAPRQADNSEENNYEQPIDVRRSTEILHSETDSTKATSGGAERQPDHRENTTTPSAYPIDDFETPEMSYSNVEELDKKASTHRPPDESSFPGGRNRSSSLSNSHEDNNVHDSLGIENKNMDNYYYTNVTRF